MLKKNKIILFVPLIIIIVIIIYLIVLYSRNSHTLVYNEMKFTIPDNFKISKDDDGNINISTKDNWESTVVITPSNTTDNEFNTIDELYEFEINNPSINIFNAKLSKIKVDDIDVFVCDYVEVNMIIYTFKTSYGDFCSISFERKNENDDKYISEIIKSLYAPTISK